MSFPNIRTALATYKQIGANGGSFEIIQVEALLAENAKLREARSRAVVDLSSLEAVERMDGNGSVADECRRIRHYLADTATTGEVCIADKQDYSTPDNAATSGTPCACSACSTKSEEESSE